MFRIKGRLGPTALSAFPSMVSELKGNETVLTGQLEDRSAVFGVVAQIEALGLELLELRQVRPGPKLNESGDDRPVHGVRGQAPIAEAKDQRPSQPSTGR